MRFHQKSKHSSQEVKILSHQALQLSYDQKLYNVCKNIDYLILAILRKTFKLISLISLSYSCGKPNIKINNTILIRNIMHFHAFLKGHAITS